MTFGEISLTMVAACALLFLLLARNAPLVECDDFDFDPGLLDRNDKSEYVDACPEQS